MSEFVVVFISENEGLRGVRVCTKKTNKEIMEQVLCSDIKYDPVIFLHTCLSSFMFMKEKEGKTENGEKEMK